MSCCKMKANYEPENAQQCIETPNESNSNFKTGCMSNFRADITEYFTMILAVCGGVVGFQVLFVSIAITIACLQRRIGEESVKHIF